MEQPKDNKKLEPKSNKSSPSPQPPPSPPPNTESTDLGEGVRIKMRPGKAAEGVTVDKDGYATVEAKLAEHLVKINYADYAE
jgi:hypothetical protein